MPALLDVVKNTIWREQLIGKGEMVLVAVSGGADSLSLLHLLNGLKGMEELPFFLHVAHLNHGLRGKHAREDAEFVREEAKRLALPFTIGEVDAEIFRKKWKLSPEDASRRLRYRFLVQLAERIGAVCIATGHNRDDQAETVLLNFLRGTGLDGLTGMKFKRSMEEGPFLIRPLLKAGRQEILFYCQEKGLNPREDETNLQNHFFRNKLRLELIPLMEKDYNPRLREGLARMTGLLSLDMNFLEEYVGQRFSRVLLEEDPYTLILHRKKLLDEHEAVQNRLLRRGVRKLLGTVPREIGPKHIGAILKLCRSNYPHGTLRFSHGLRAYRSYDELTLSQRELPQAKGLSSYTLKVPGAKNILEKGFTLQAELFSPSQLSWPPDQQKEVYLDYHKVLELAGDGTLNREYPPEDSDELEIIIRPRKPGDRFYPLGAPGKKKLKKYLIDQKVPLKERDRIPLVVAGEEIVWVMGKQISHYCRVTEGTRKVLVLKIIPKTEGAEDEDTGNKGSLN